MTHSHEHVYKYLPSFTFQHQLSDARLERESNAKEIDHHKCTITEREVEIKTLLLQLQRQEALIQKLEQESAVVSTKQELELAQKLVQVTSEVAGLRDRLEKAEEGKRDATREMEAVRVKSELVQQRMTELGEQTHVSLGSSVCWIPCHPHVKYMHTLTEKSKVVYPSLIPACNNNSCYTRVFHKAMRSLRRQGTFSRR